MKKLIDMVKQARLSKLQWIAILASLAWVVGSVEAKYSDQLASANETARLLFEICTEKQIKNPPVNLKLCEAEKLIEYERMTEDIISQYLIFALIPVPLVWLYAYIAFTLIRSLYVGHGIVVDFQSLSKIKKLFALFCYLMSALLLLIMLMIYLENQVDQKVPPKSGENFRVWNYENRYVTVNGTWKSDNSRGESNLLFPMHTTEIRCEKDTKRCVEARANLSLGEFKSLMVDMNNYEIESWTNSSIVFKNSRTCVETIYMIDLISQAVNGIEKITDAEGCSYQSKDYEPATYRLVDGDIVFKELREKNRPWLQRIIFAIFN